MLWHQHLSPSQDWIIFHCMDISRLFIHWFMNIWVVFTFWLLWVILKYHSCIVFCMDIYFLSDVYLAMELLSNSIFNLLRNCQIVFLITAPQFYVPTSNIWGFQLIHIIAMLFILFCLCVIAILVGMKW